MLACRVHTLFFADNSLVAARAMARVFPGPPRDVNRDAIDWSSNGLLAFASETSVVVMDGSGEGMHVVQVLDGFHKSGIVRVRWSPAAAGCDSQCLASGDLAGVVVVHNVLAAESTPLLSSHIDLGSLSTSKFSQRVCDVQWHPSLPHLILVMYAGGIVVTFDVAKNREIWTTRLELTNAQQLVIDPFGGLRFCVVDDEGWTLFVKLDENGRLRESQVGASPTGRDQSQQQQQQQQQQSSRKFRLLKTLERGKAPARKKGLWPCRCVLRFSSDVAFRFGAGRRILWRQRRSAAAAVAAAVLAASGDPGRLLPHRPRPAVLPLAHAALHL